MAEVRGSTEVSRYYFSIADSIGDSKSFAGAITCGGNIKRHQKFSSRQRHSSLRREKASHGLGSPLEGVLFLSENPQRGAYPKELYAIGLRKYREVFFKPYRIIYRIMAKRVTVFVIPEGRRDMQTLLQRRLLQA